MRTYAGFFYVGTLDGGPPIIKNMPAVSGIYTEGMPLRLSATTGSVAAGIAAGTTIYGVCTANLTAAESVVGRAVPCIVADGNAVFEGKMIATKAPQSKVGDFADLAAIATSYNYRLSGSAASTKVARIVGFHADEALTTHTGVRFRVVFPKNLTSADRQAGG